MLEPSYKLLMRQRHAAQYQAHLQAVEQLGKLAGTSRLKKCWRAFLTWLEPRRLYLTEVAEALSFRTLTPHNRWEADDVIAGLCRQIHGKYLSPLMLRSPPYIPPSLILLSLFFDLKRLEQHRKLSSQSIQGLCVTQCHSTRAQHSRRQGSNSVCSVWCERHGPSALTEKAVRYKKAEC
jgi:hypothetical protein